MNININIQGYQATPAPSLYNTLKEFGEEKGLIDSDSLEQLKKNFLELSLSGYSTSLAEDSKKLVYNIENGIKTSFLTRNQEAKVLEITSFLKGKLGKLGKLEKTFQEKIQYN